MALKLTITDNRGVSCDYHRILSQTQAYDGVNDGIYINLAGYVNAGYRTIEKNTGENTAVMNTPVFLPFNGSSLNQANIYTRIKTEIEQFTPSTDI